MQKPIIYAPIPEFDQTTQAAFQTEAVEMDDHIFIGVVVVELPQGEVV